MPSKCETFWDKKSFAFVGHSATTSFPRRIAGAGGSQPRKDAFDERNYRKGRVGLLRLDGFVGDDEKQGLVDWAELEGCNPVRRMISAIDLERWLSTLDAEDRLMLALRQAGHSLGDIGAATGRPTSLVCARLCQLGEELAARADLKLGMGRHRAAEVCARGIPMRRTP
jgi:hypothetical protein